MASVSAFDHGQYLPTPSHQASNRRVPVRGFIFSSLIELMGQADSCKRRWCCLQCDCRSVAAPRACKIQLPEKSVREEIHERSHLRRQMAPADTPRRWCAWGANCGTRPQALA
jgi:hypothetical protein